MPEDLAREEEKATALPVAAGCFILAECRGLVGVGSRKRGVSKRGQTPLNLGGLTPF
jgi:hypothetical protein